MITRSSPPTHRWRLKALSGAVACALTTAGLVAFAEPASAGNFGYTLEGCQQSGTIKFPAGGPYICPDAKGDYTTGNLGKNWNELDLVPHRLTLTDDEAEAVKFTYGGDHYKVDPVANPGTAVGWDAISPLVLNAGLSKPGCDPDPLIGGQKTAPGETGGAFDTIEREATVDMPGGKGVCVYDYHQRLALGAHLYPGSSLQSYIAAGGGKKTLSLPVQEALPQELGKTMSAVRDATQIWSVSKKSDPAKVTFSDTCITGENTKADVNITVSWKKVGLTPSGDVTIMTTISAKNPAARAVDVYAHDDIYAGATASGTPVKSFVTPTVTVPAGATVDLVKDKIVVLTDGATTYNDVATGHYVDTVTTVPIPQTTTAKATAAVAQGKVANSSIVVTDVESIAGAGFSYSVAAPAYGSFDGYTAGTKTTGDVKWASGPQTDDGSITFTKTVYGAMGTIGSGTLSDVASIYSGDTLLTKSDTLKVDLSSDTRVNLTIDKTLDPAADSDLTFLFDIVRDGTAVQEDVPIKFVAGDTAESAVLTGLTPGTYMVREQALYPFPAQESVDVPLPGTSVAACSGSVSVANEFEPPIAQVKKVTEPTGQETGWTFTLQGPGLPAEGVTTTTTGTGFEGFGGTALTTGVYTITETGQTDWDLTDISGNVGGVAGPGTAERDGSTCKLTVDELLDADRVFQCTFTNTQRGHVKIVKQTVPEKDDRLFDFSLTGPAGLSQSFTLADGQTHDSGAVVPGTYNASETIPAGWDNTSAKCDDGSPVDAISLQAGETVTCTFVNTKRGHIVVDKVTDPSGDPQLFDFALTGGPGSIDQKFQLADQTAKHDSGAVLAGTYAVVETMPAGWDPDTVLCTDGETQYDPSTLVLSAGKTITCTFTNVKRGEIVVKKVTAPTGDPASFDFTLTGGPSGLNQAFSLSDASSHNSGLVKPGSGYAAAETVPAGWDLTKASCSDGSPVANVVVSAGEVVTCTFVNTKRGAVKVVKSENGATPTHGYTFRLTGGPDSVSVSRTTDSTNLGKLDFGLLKPGTYTMCELAVPAGTHSTLQDAPYNGTLDSTTGDVCVKFTLAAGGSQTFTVDNTYPLGNARTIGYWKNWNTCAKATWAKAAKTGNHLMDEFLPIYLPKDPTPDVTTDYNGYKVATCTQGVAVLGAASGKYAENQLAAQLLATKLNVKAGAKVSATTKTKIAEALTLLQQLKYHGPPSAIVGSTHPLRTKVLGYATYFDKYNNNLIV